MRYKHPIRQILTATRSSWDRPETRPAVRASFDKMTKCGTLALGADVFASETEKRIVPHTCKARPCPSCGHRATIQWQREQWCALPDIPFTGIVFTMPDVLWRIFQQNRHLLHDLPHLGAAVVQQWAKLKHGVRVSIMVIPHTFGGHLNFNSHLHMLVSAGGLEASGDRWIAGPILEKADKTKLMKMWRFTVISYLRAVLQANVLASALSGGLTETFLTTQYKRWWNIHIDRLISKEYFLRYAGRYVRRPPIAQHRITKITDREVEFWVKDKIKKRRVKVSSSAEEFVAKLAEHVPDRYRHGVRYFGLLAPRSKARTSDAVFLLLAQKRRPRPRRLTWAFSLQRDFGKNPLVDRNGQTMKWIRRLKPCT